MEATRTLPDEYAPSGKIDLANNKWAAIVLNLIAVALLFVFGFLFGWLALALRPALGSITFLLDGGRSLLIILTILVMVFLQIVIHELIHGLFFWVYTRHTPKFGFKGYYAYAGAPDWYLPRNQHIVTGLAPLVLMSLAGLALIPIAPTWSLPAIFYTLVVNAAGSVGDMAVVGWLFRQPTSTLVQDVGDAVTIYQQKQPA